MNTQEVILVTETDEPIGTIEKIRAHTDGLLHRAFSVFIFDKKGNTVATAQKEFTQIFPQHLLLVLYYR